MLTFVQGFGTGAGLIIAIGAQNAFVLSQGVRKNYNWLVAAICSICDALLILLGAAGVGSLVANNPSLRIIAGWGGALFLFYYGCRALRSAINPGALSKAGSGYVSRIAVISATLAVTLLNPHVYLDTMVLIGSLSGQFDGNGRYLFALGACAASTFWFYTLSLGGVLLSPFFTSTRAWRILDVVVWLTMWFIALQIAPINW